jgi:hypothetical protein
VDTRYVSMYYRNTKIAPKWVSVNQSLYDWFCFGMLMEFLNSCPDGTPIAVVRIESGKRTLEYYRDCSPDLLALLLKAK